MNNQEIAKEAAIRVIRLAREYEDSPETIEPIILAAIEKATDELQQDVFYARQSALSEGLRADAMRDLTTQEYSTRAAHASEIAEEAAREFLPDGARIPRIRLAKIIQSAIEKAVGKPEALPEVALAEPQTTAAQPQRSEMLEISRKTA